MFPPKSYTKYGEETIPMIFSKKSKLHVSLDQQSEMVCKLYSLHFQIVYYQNILKLMC